MDAQLVRRASISCCSITEPTGNQVELIAYYHAAMGSLTESTLTDAIRKRYVSRPGPTAELVVKFPPYSVATAKGHMDKCRQGHRSRQEETNSDIHRSITTRRSVFTKKCLSMTFVTQT